MPIKYGFKMIKAFPVQLVEFGGARYYKTLYELLSFHNYNMLVQLGHGSLVHTNAVACSRLRAIINKTVRYAHLPTHNPS